MAICQLCRRLRGLQMSYICGSRCASERQMPSDVQCAAELERAVMRRRHAHLRHVALPVAKEALFAADNNECIPDAAAARGRLDSASLQASPRLQQQLHPVQRRCQRLPCGSRPLLNQRRFLSSHECICRFGRGCKTRSAMRKWCAVAGASTALGMCAHA